MIEHPEAFTAQTLSEVEHVKGRRHAKVVMIKSGGELVMGVVPADHRVDLEKFERLSGTPASLSSFA